MEGAGVYDRDNRSTRGRGEKAKESCLLVGKLSQMGSRHLMYTGLLLAGAGVLESEAHYVTDRRAPYAYCCQTARASVDYKFCNNSLSIDERVEDLVQRIGWDDAGPQLTARESVSIPELGLSSYYWGTNAANVITNIDCLQTGQCVTGFPAPSGLGAIWNFSLIEEMGKVFATELRAFVNAGAHNGLNVWGPTINVHRDPRWGRNFETSSEDPLLLAEYAKAFTSGIQNGEDSRYIKAVVTLKHWIAYSLESYGNYTRHNFDAQVSAFDMADTYMPAWEAAVREAGAMGVMCSYNSVNGVPTCGNPKLAAILREDWGFKGYMTSDSDSCQDIYQNHNFASNGSLATAACLEGGTDINSGNTYTGYLHDAISNHFLQEETARNALRNAYRVRMRLGLFDPHVASPYREIPPSAVGHPAHHELSKMAARKSMVLLKNDRNTLPFAIGRRVAVIGGAADQVEALLGNNAGPICPDGKLTCFPSLFEQVKAINAGGLTRMHADVNDTEAAVRLVEWSDMVILVAADPAGHEGHDRTRVTLDQFQTRLCHTVLKSASGKPVALILINGGPLSIDDLIDSSPAILEAFTPGPHGARAIAETLFGANNPGGKLPITIYPKDYIDKVDFFNMSMTTSVGRSYRYYTGKPLFKFGFGLSYTNFSMEWGSGTSKPSQFGEGLPRNVSVRITNNGTVEGDEVVQVYMRPISVSMQTRAPLPLSRLIGFKRVLLTPGTSKEISFTIGEYQLSLVNSNGDRNVYPGVYEIEVSRGHGKVLQDQIKIDGKYPKTLARFRRFW